MFRTVLLFAAVVIAVVSPGVVYADASAGGFTCPKPGTVVKSANGMSVVYHGTEPGDSVVCLKTSSIGRDLKELYNWYSVDSGRDPTAARAAMQDLFSGKVSKVSFETDVTFANVRRTPGPRTYLNTWSRVGEDVLAIDGRQIRTVVFDYEREGEYLVGFHGKWKIWFDPSSGLFLKGAFTPIKGTPRENPDWQVVSITVP